MAFMFVHSGCAACGTVISYHPDHVPSITVKGERCAICRACHASWNAIHRTSKGLPEIPLHPDAYEPQEV